LTGVLLAFERQIVTFAERHIHTVQRSSYPGPRLDLDTLMAAARAAFPDDTPSAVTLSAEPMGAVIISFGRDRNVFVDPYTGAVLGEGARAWRGFFRTVTDWHRWLGRDGEHRETGRAITGACNAAFAVLVTTSFYLWWPRHWTRVALKAVTVPNVKLRGKRRDWNWHNVVGFWCAPILLCITLSGLVISYRWAGNLIYSLTGSEAPPQPQRPIQGRAVTSANGQSRTAAGTMEHQPDGPIGRQPHLDGEHRGERRGRGAQVGELHPASPRMSLEAGFAAAVREAPHWRRINMRLPQRTATSVTVMIEEAVALHPYPRSTLTLDATTAAVIKWEPYAAYNLGRIIRSWVRPVHTGEAGGLIGQGLAALASAGGAILVCTGLALAWRRLWRRR
jgi:uncharacterized iron-regulated membrane protein